MEAWWKQWTPRATVPVHDEDDEACTCSCETKSLLPASDLTKQPLNPSYNTLSQHDNVLERSLSAWQESSLSSSEGRAKTPSRAPLTLFLQVSSALVLMALFSFVTFNHFSEPPRGKHFSQMLLSELVFAPDVADTTTTFRCLAQSLMPAWYEETVSHLPVFTPTVKPGHVYKTRKIILKTRDLIDVFSPVYPNITAAAAAAVDDDNVDMWRLIRHYLNEGYMIVGEFQDLHNAHVMYSQEQMEELRTKVLQWKREFEQFHETHEAVEFLSSASSGSYHHKESRLFWKSAETRPSGGDSATSSLQVLGMIQLQQVLDYLWLAMPYASVLEEDAHQHYHNLRKELRSVVDEFELFGGIMFPAMPGTDSSMTVLRRARKLLGDINDDWTAYSIYVENDEYYSEQERLAKEIDDAWAYFQSWIHKSNFEGAVQYLLESLNPVQPAEVLEPSVPKLNHYLKERKKRPTQHIVIGNEAGDADSIISAITLAYIESMQESIQSTPIVSIPRNDLATQRPEVKLLLELAGIPNAATDLIFVDDPLIVEDDASAANVTLVDHNVLADKFWGKNWTVVEIVDHHEDQKQYLETCSGTARTIAFANDKALVASACTLIAERLSEVWQPPYPPSLGVLLLGVILLDSVNLSPEVGKVTQRDQDAVADLLENTDWQDLPEESQIAIGMDLSIVPDTPSYFDVLQDAKYDSSFWNSLSVIDALRYDYKEFSYDGHTFGVSTVLMPLQCFFRKDNLAAGVAQYMADVDVDFLGIMFAFEDESRLCRQLALCGRNGFPLDDMDAFLHQSGFYHDPLDLKEIEDVSIILQGDEGLSLQFFDQNNVKPSRKQIGPILLEFFESAASTEDQGLTDSRTLYRQSLPKYA